MSETPFRKLRARLVGATILACLGLTLTGASVWALDDDLDGDEADSASILLPTGHRITPTCSRSPSSGLVLANSAVSCSD